LQNKYSKIPPSTSTNSEICVPNRVISSEFFFAFLYPESSNQNVIRAVRLVYLPSYLTFTLHPTPQTNISMS